MHLLLVTETWPPEVNGVALTVQGLRDELRAAGHRVTLLRPRQPGESGDCVGPDEFLSAGLPIPRYPQLRFGLPAGRLLRRLLRGQRPDAVYVATEGPLGSSALRAARAAGVPVASGFHTRFDDYFRHYGARWLQALARRWLRRFHNRASCTLVPTIELQQWLQGQGYQRVELLRRAVDTALFDPARRDPALRRQLGVADGAPLVLSVGRLAAEKNLGLALRAFEAIRVLAPGARMLWVGDGPERVGLQRAHPDHHFTGLLRGAELARHYASADLFLFPSLSETYGNVTLEAMASGLATVAFDYGAAHEHLAPGCGERAPFGDEAAFLDAVRCATADWLAGRRPGAAARAAVAALSPARVAEDLVQLLAAEVARQAAIERFGGIHAAVHSTLL